MGVLGLPMLMDGNLVCCCMGVEHFLGDCLISNRVAT